MFVIAEELAALEAQLKAVEAAAQQLDRVVLDQGMSEGAVRALIARAQMALAPRPQKIRSRNSSTAPPPR